MKQLYQIALWFLMVAVLPITSVAQNNGVIIDTTVCGSFEWHGSTYTVSDTLVFNSEDSTMVDTTINLTVNHPDSVEFTKTACEEYAWNGVTYNTSGNYTQTFTNIHGCDSVVTLHLTVNHPDHSSTTIDTCESYTWTDGNGQTYTTSGDYTYSHEDANGCTQVDTLHLIINRPTYGDTTAVACGSFRWHGYSNLTESGEYTDTLTNAVGCDSVVTLLLTIHHGTHNTDSASACGRYRWHGTTYTASGTHWYEYTNDDGCPSVDTLHLIINNPTHNSVSDTACETYTWTDGTGETYTSSGTYLHPHEDDNGCWQVDTLHLTINHATYGDTTVVACESFTWHGITYTETPAIAPTDTIIGGDHNGCDSVVTLHLTIHLGTHNVFAETACESYTWYGTTYTASGTYTYPYNNEYDCPSVDTLYLTINNPAHTSITRSACGGYEWHETTYTESGDYFFSHPDVNGCTQVDTLHLTINNPIHLATTVTTCESYTWNGTIYTVSGNYTYAHPDAHDCWQVDTLHLTINHVTYGDTTVVTCETFTWYGTTYTETPAIAPTYTIIGGNHSGCDSIVTLHLTIHHGTHNVFTETVCESYTWHGTTYTASGTYTYPYINEYGCPSVDTLLLVITPNPTPFIFGDSSICYGDVATLTAAGGETYQWSTEDVGNSIVVAMEGLYTVTATNMFGCSSTAEFTVSIAASPLAKKDIVGKSHADGSYYMLIYPEADLQYQWYKNNVVIIGATKQYYYPSDYTHEGSLDMDACYQVEVRPNDPYLCGIMTDCWEKPESVTEKIRILPNPNDGWFRLMLPGESTEVQILNANGQVVMSRKVDGTNMLDLSVGLANGFYIVKVFRENGEIYTEKLVINR